MVPRAIHIDGCPGVLDVLLIDTIHVYAFLLQRRGDCLWVN